MGMQEKMPAPDRCLELAQAIKFKRTSKHGRAVREFMNERVLQS